MTSSLPRVGGSRRAFGGKKIRGRPITSFVETAVAARRRQRFSSFAGMQQSKCRHGCHRSNWAKKGRVRPGAPFPL
jgi:hypothetical protein